MPSIILLWTLSYLHVMYDRESSFLPQQRRYKSKAVNNSKVLYLARTPPQSALLQLKASSVQALQSVQSSYQANFRVILNTFQTRSEKLQDHQQALSTGISVQLVRNWVGLALKQRSIFALIFPVL